MALMPMTIEKRFRAALIVITDLLVLSILPADTVLQIVTSATILFPLSLGIQMFSIHGWHFEILDVLLCVPYILMLGLYLKWTSIISILGNLFILTVSASGVYGYINTKKKSPKARGSHSAQ